MSKKTAIATLNYALNDTITKLNNTEASLGLDTSGNYVLDSGANFIQTASTVKQAVTIIDARLYSIATTYAPLAYVNTQISNLVNSAPEVLDTLSEIAAALGNDPNLATTLSNQISTESSTARAAEQALTSSLTAEVTRATGAESTLTASLTSEITRATSAEQTLSTILSGETSRAVGSEQTLSTLVATEIATRAAEISTLQASSNSTITGLSGSTTSGIDSEIARATGAEDILNAAIYAEQVRAVNAENALSGNLDAEIIRATGAESTLTVSLNTESARAQAAELALQNRVSTIEVTYINKNGSVAFTGDLDLASNLIQNVAAPVDATDATNKLYVDTKVSNLGSVFEYVGTVSPSVTPNLDSLAKKDTGDYYRVTVKGTFTYSGGSLSANAGDGVVRNTVGGWDLIDNTDPVVSGTADRLTVTGDATDGYVADIASTYVGQNTIITLGTVTTGIWNATPVATLYGGSGQTTYTQGDLLLGTSGGSLSKLTVGSNGTMLLSDGATANWSQADTANISMTDATNFSTSTTLQQSLDYLYDFTQIRKLAQHAITSSTDYANSNVGNVNLQNGKVNFINYNSSNTNIFMPPTSAGLVNGTVFRIVHNGTFTDSNYTVMYQDVAGGSNVSVLELAPKDSIALVWNNASSSYLYAVGI
jgi:hypothetical protein